MLPSLSFYDLALIFFPIAKEKNSCMFRPFPMGALNSLPIPQGTGGLLNLPPFSSESIILLPARTGNTNSMRRDIEDPRNRRQFFLFLCPEKFTCGSRLDRHQFEPKDVVPRSFRLSPVADLERQKKSFAFGRASIYLFLHGFQILCLDIPVPSRNDQPSCFNLFCFPPVPNIPSSTISFFSRATAVGESTSGCSL